MSDLFEALSQRLAEGHSRPVEGLLTDDRFDPQGLVTPAAVLIAVTDRRNAPPGVLLTQRPTTMRDHPGQVAFPGGKIDQGEDAVAAALREAEEELAVPPDAVRIIGTSDLYKSGTGFDITPVLAVVPPDLPLRANPREVESWFEVPLETLLHPDNWQEKEAMWKGGLRRYLEMDYQGYRIWGVTAAIIVNLSRRLRWNVQA